MFQIQIHATGSSGNAYSIIDGNQKILIDPGIAFAKLRQATGFTLSQYDFALISHEHKDHCKAAAGLARIGMPLFVSRGTANDLGLTNGVTRIIASQRQFEALGWQILPFAIQHDAAEPLGFLIQSPSGRRICYATDTYYLKYLFTGVTHWMIEANYSERMLRRNEELPPSVKRRIRASHFEIENVKRFFQAQDLSRTEKIYLIHLSGDNSDEKMFVSMVEKITGKIVFL